MPSRRIEDLHQVMQAQVKTFMYACEEEWPGKDVDVFPTCTFRSTTEQNYLFSLGRTIKSHVGPWSETRPLGRTVTNARGGQSAHNYEVGGKPMALAIDLAILVHGKLDWDDKRSPYWKKVGEIGMDLGLDWYGRPGSKFFEAAHFQHSLWKELRNG